MGTDESSWRTKVLICDSIDKMEELFISCAVSKTIPPSCPSCATSVNIWLELLNFGLQRDKLHLCECSSQIVFFFYLSAFLLH